MVSIQFTHMMRDRIWTLMSRKLSGEANEAELTELSELVTSHPDIQLPVNFMNEFWLTPVEKEEDFLEATFHLHTARLKEKGYDLELNNEETGTLNLSFPPTENNLQRKLLIAAATVVTAAILVLIIFTTTPNTVKQKFATSEVSTKAGSRTKIQLPDGSSVWLNSSSKLTYDNENFGTGVREVSLIGEAYFDVVKNAAKPFIIHTAKMDIKVLGTAFNVKCYPGEKNTETSLIHGSIEVTVKDRQEKIMLKASEKLIINDAELKSTKTNKAKQEEKVQPAKSKPLIELGHLTLYPTDNAIVETGWMENRLLFSSETLEEIALKMERWYGVTIIITNNRLKKELLTGSFDKETIKEALDALQLTTPFTYKAEKNIISISK